MLPSEYPEVQSYSHLQRLLADHIDMQFEDVRLLLRLPRKGSTVGGNFVPRDAPVRGLAASALVVGLA